jgi:hypothetical protein
VTLAVRTALAFAAPLRVHPIADPAPTPSACRPPSPLRAQHVFHNACSALLDILRAPASSSPCLHAVCPSACVTAFHRDTRARAPSAVFISLIHQEACTITSQHENDIAARCSHLSPTHTALSPLRARRPASQPSRSPLTASEVFGARVQQRGAYALPPQQQWRQCRARQICLARAQLKAKGSCLLT